jgi:hypothetical protein
VIDGGFAGTAFGTASRNRIGFKGRCRNHFPARSVPTVMGPIANLCVRYNVTFCKLNCSGRLVTPCYPMARRFSPPSMPWPHRALRRPDLDQGSDHSVRDRTFQARASNDRSHPGHVAPFGSMARIYARAGRGIRRGHELHEKPRPVSAAWQRVSYLRQNSAKIVRHLLEHNWRR